MPVYPLGPVNMVGQSMAMGAGTQSMFEGGMRMRAQGMDGKKPGVGPSLPTTTFDPSFGGVWLSNKNLTVTGDPAPNYPIARSSTTKKTGKYYFEVASPTSVINVLGLISTTVPFSTSTAYLTNTGVTLLQTNGIGWRDGASSSSGISALAGAVYFVGVAIDLDNRKVWIKSAISDWNGISTSNPATNTGGFVIGTGVAVGSSVHAAASPIGDNSLTVNFGATPYVVGAPSGFSNWT